MPTDASESGSSPTTPVRTPPRSESGFDENNEFARAIFDALAEGVLVVDERARIVAMNPSAERVLGFRAATLIGKNVRDSPWILEDENERRVPVEEWPIVVALETGAPAGQLLVTLRPDGARRIIVMIAMPLPLPEGVRWTVVSFVDVTRERSAELALSSSEQRFRHLVEQAPDPVIVVNAAGEIQLCNQATGDVFGYSPEELVGQPIEVLVPGSVREAHRNLRSEFFKAPVSRAMATGSELSGRRRDGSQFPVEVSLSPFESAEGTAVIAIARDLTERRRAVELAQAERAKSEFLSRMSHELRTPLNSILGFGQLLDLGQPRPDQVEAVEQIQRAGRHLLDLLNDLLEFERVRSGHVSFSIEPVRVGDVVAEAIKLVEPLALEQLVTIVPTVEHDSGAWAACDSQRLHQVLLNLLSNAIKYNRRGGEVRTEIATTNDHVRIAVNDTGPGISEGLLPSLFVPFERLGADAGVVQGTGVGLALSKMLAEGMGGTIDVSTEVGAGSTFTVQLERTEPVAIEASAAPASTMVGMFGDALANLVVLSIEDNEANVKLMESLLAAFGVGQSFTARTAEEGIELARRVRPDCVLLDLHLPDQPGEHVVTALRDDPQTRDIPIVVVTADATRASQQRLGQLGIADYLTKPVDVRALYEAVSRCSPASG